MKVYQSLPQRTPEWYNVRLGVITGSEVERVLGSPKVQETYRWQIVAEMFTVPDQDAPDNESAAARGVRLEPEAFAMYQFETGRTITQVGFTKKDDNPRIGSSPDCLSPDYTHAVEIKCMGGINHLQAILSNDVPQYRAQIRQYFIVNEALKTLDVFLYNPDMPRFMTHIITYTREQLLGELDEQLQAEEAFLESCDDLAEQILNKHVLSKTNKPEVAAKPKARTRSKSGQEKPVKVRKASNRRKTQDN